MATNTMAPTELNQASLTETFPVPLLNSASGVEVVSLAVDPAGDETFAASMTAGTVGLVL
jgi:hypothetical protein